MNESLLRRLGANTVLGGEFEAGLGSVIERLRAAPAGAKKMLPTEPVVSLGQPRLQTSMPPLPGGPGLSGAIPRRPAGCGPGRHQAAGGGGRGAYHLWRPRLLQWDRSRPGPRPDPSYGTPTPDV